MDVFTTPAFIAALSAAGGASPFSVLTNPQRVLVFHDLLGSLRVCHVHAGSVSKPNRTDEEVLALKDVIKHLIMALSYLALSDADLLEARVWFRLHRVALYEFIMNETDIRNRNLSNGFPFGVIYIVNEFDRRMRALMTEYCRQRSLPVTEENMVAASNALSGV